MQSSIKQIFYVIAFYDTVDQKWKHANNNTYYGAKRYRNELLQDKRYTNISNVYTSTLDL